MKHPSINSQIHMTLVIGAHELALNHKHVIKMHSLDCQISLNLASNLQLKNFLVNPKLTQPFICSYKFASRNHLHVFNDQNQDLLDLHPSQKHFFLQKQHPSHKQNDHEHKFSFQILVLPSADPHKIKIKISQQDLCFELVRISSSIKFVKNQILNELLNTTSKRVKGLLTMDQSSRFLLQSLTMPFPVIGFWLKTDQNIQEIELIEHLSQFIKGKYEKKCMFKSCESGERHFYFVRMTEEKRMETFLVAWKVNQLVVKEYLINLSASQIQLSSNSASVQQNEPSLLQKSPTTTTTKQFPSIQPKSQPSTSIQTPKSNFPSSCQNSSSSSSGLTSQQNGMNFTLRNHSKDSDSSPALESLINYSYLSPIKQLESSTQNQNLFSQTYHNSPQFSTLIKHAESQECVELREKVQAQEGEIFRLKEIIAEMQSELKLYKNSRMSTHYESNRKKPHFSGGISSPESNPFSLGSNPGSKNSSPQAVGRLRQSDLRSNSVSWSGEWLKNSSNKKGLGWRCERSSGSKQGSEGKQGKWLQGELREQSGGLAEITEEETRQEGKDPWDYMEIIED